MMKLSTQIISIVLFSCCICIASCKRKVYETNRITGYEGKLLPAFNLQMPDSVTYLNTADLKRGKPVVLFFFGADCPYCKEQITEIKQHMTEMQNVQFVLFTGESFNDMERFIRENDLSGYKNVIVGRDTADYFALKFKATGYPYTAFYDEKKKLRCVYVGRMKIEKLVYMAI